MFRGNAVLSSCSVKSVLTSQPVKIPAPPVARAEVEKRIWQWRHLMEYFLIKRYQACIDALQGGSDAVGARPNSLPGGVSDRKCQKRFCVTSGTYRAHLEAFCCLPMLPC